MDFEAVSLDHNSDLYPVAFHLDRDHTPVQLGDQRRTLAALLVVVVVAAGTFVMWVGSGKAEMAGRAVKLDV